jgi:hypothetical protein
VGLLLPLLTFKARGRSAVNKRVGLIFCLLLKSAWALPSFQLTSTASTNVPFTIGHAFKQGEVPSGSNIMGSPTNVQAVVKNRWPDGSVKFALISGRTNMPATIALSIGTSASGTPVSAPTFSASIGAGTFGSASFSNADSPFMTWVSGPVMSSWIYRKPIGSDAHLVGWLEVRAYAGGEVEVRPWVENGYLKVSGPTSKSATYTFSLGGSQRFSQAIDLLNHQRTVLASGSAFTYWLGTDPQVVPKLDVVYLQNSRLVPRYVAATSSSSTLWNRMSQTYTPLAVANHSPSMGTTGYHPSIGPLPEWDVAYLTSSADSRAFNAVIVNAYSAGRYGSHFRDETTNRPLKFSSYPNLVMGGGTGFADIGASSTSSYTPDATGTSPPTFKTSHHPSFGYMAYLLTGSFYFMEETQFVATANFLKQSDGGAYANRGGSKGLMRTDAGTNQPRGAAWALRTLVQASTTTPDGDALQSEFINSFSENVNYYHSIFIAQANNPQGTLAPYGNPYGNDNAFVIPWWMEDFLSFAFGYGKDLVALTSTVSAKLDAFTTWKYKSVVGRLGGSGSTEFCYRDAALYEMIVAPCGGAVTAACPTGASNWLTGTGPWFADWGALWRASTGKASNDCSSGTDLRNGYPDEPTGYWSNLRPAIAYAVTHNATGAVAAYGRLTGSANYATYLARYNDDPTWSLIPHVSIGNDTTKPKAPGGLRVQ